MAETKGKKRKIILTLLALLLPAALLISYFTWWPLPLEEAYEFDLKSESVVLTIEEGNYGEETLDVEKIPRSSWLALRGRKAAAQTISWTSSDPGVATVDEAGRIRAADRGEALITANWGGLTESCRVTVYYPLKGIELSARELTLNKGEEASLSCAPLPPQAEIDGAVTYESANPGVAAVDEKGLVKALTVGETVITARSGAFESVCTVRVLSPMEGIRMEEDAYTVNVGEKLPLPVYFTPEDTTDDRSLLWESTAPAVAAVDGLGQVTALTPGRAAITARAGDFSATALLTVLAPLKGIALQEESLRLEKGESARLTLLPEPVNTTDILRPVFTSDHPEIVWVNRAGRLEALGPGEARITVQTGDFSAYCTVFVRVPMEGIALEDEGGELIRGEERTLSVAFFPVDTNDDRAILWESSDPKVLQVDEAGTIRALAAGEALIRAVCGDFSDEIRFTVRVPAEGIELDETSLELVKNASFSLIARLLPADTTDLPDIRFESSNPAVASVDGEGHIWAAGPGECIITARQGELTAQCRVQVTVPMSGIYLDQAEISLLEGRQARLNVVYEPWDTTDPRNVNWSSSDSAVASVDGAGNIYAQGAGDCWITAAVGNFSASARVHVDPYISVQSVSLSHSDVTFSYIGETARFSAWAEPSWATFPQISWSSSNNAVATVDGEGLVRAAGAGECTITAQAEGKSASCIVRVLKGKVVVLDPGHGGIFSGAVWEGREEKRLNLTTAYACKNYLEANYKGVTVYMTRSGDASTSEDLRTDLYNRAAYASRVGADILVSLHYNASGDHAASGVGVYASFSPGISYASNTLARMIVNRLVAHTGLRSHGVLIRYNDEVGQDVSQGDYYGIIRHSASFGIPAVLVEHCHMDYDTWCVDSEGDLVNLGIQDALAIAEYLGLEHK